MYCLFGRHRPTWHFYAAICASPVKYDWFEKRWKMAAVGPPYIAPTMGPIPSSLAYLL